MLKVGILGMGGMGWFHASRLFQLPNAKLTAIADIRPERLEAKHAVTINIADTGGAVDLGKVARYPDASRLIAEAGVDVVDICLPSYLHARYAIEALEAGKHVLTEKPMALSVEDANAMIAAAGHAKRKLMVAQCIRFWPEYQFLRRCVQEKTFGKLLSLSFTRICGRPIWSWEDWMLDPAKSGGAMYDLHVHDVDFVNSLLGMPGKIQAVRRVSAHNDEYDIIHAIYTYPDGPQVHLYGGWGMAQAPFNSSYEAWFERGFVRLDPAQNLTVFRDLTKAEGQPAQYERGDAYYKEIAYFIDCVQNDVPPVECPPESARNTLALLGKELAAIESSQVIPV
jgi:predicted dehydrogenase